MSENRKRIFCAHGLVSESDTVFKLIMSGEDVSEYELLLGEEKVIILKDIFRLKINVKKVGSVFLLIPLEGFDRQKAVEAITPLKDINVTNKDEARNKLLRLIDISKEFKPEAIIYNPDRDTLVPLDEFNLLNWNLPVFLYNSRVERPIEVKEKKVEPKEEVRSQVVAGLSPAISDLVQRREWTQAMKEAPTKEEQELVVKMFLHLAPVVTTPAPVENKPAPKKVEETSTKVKKEKDPNKKFSFKETWTSIVDWFKMVFAIIKKYGFYYLFMFVAILLVGFTVSIGIYNAYAGKMICVFFFICALVGATLCFFVTSDFLKVVNLKSKETNTAIAFIILGVCLSLLAFFIFYVLQKEKPTSLTNVGVVYGVTIAISIVVAVATTALAIFLKKRKENKQLQSN